MPGEVVDGDVGLVTASRHSVDSVDSCDCVTAAGPGDGDSDTDILRRECMLIGGDSDLVDFFLFLLDLPIAPSLLMEVQSTNVQKRVIAALTMQVQM